MQEQHDAFGTIFVPVPDGAHDITTAAERAAFRGVDVTRPPGAMVCVGPDLLSDARRLSEIEANRPNASKDFALRAWCGIEVVREMPAGSWHLGSRRRSYEQPS